MHFINNKTNNVIRAVCGCSLVVMIYIMIAVYKAPLGQLATLAAFFLFYVQLPGMLISRMLGVRGWHISSCIIIGTFTGWILVIGEYFLADLLNNNLLLYAAGPVLSIYYLYLVLYVEKLNPLEIRGFSITKISSCFCVFIVLALLYCLLTTQYVYLNPEYDELIIINADKAFHMGLINSLSHDYPLQSMWFKGAYFYYHIFTEILYAVPVRLFGIDADVCIMSFGPFLTTYTFCFSLYAFFREMAGMPQRAGLYSLIFLLSNIYIGRDIKTSLAFTFIFGNDNAAGYATASALMIIVVFDRWYKSFQKKENHYGLLAECTMLVMLTAGLKGPVGALIIASLWGTVIVGMLTRKMPARIVPAVFVITIGFVIVYTTVLGAKGQVNTPGGATLEFASITDVSFWKYSLVKMLERSGLIKPLRLGIVMIIYLMFFFTVFFVPFCIGYVREAVLVFSGRKQFVPGRVLVYAECLVGIVAMFVLSYSGHSQIYFGLVTIVLAPIVAFWFMEEMEDLKEVSVVARRTLHITATIMFLSLMLTTLSLISHYNACVQVAENNLDPTRGHIKYMSMSHGEYEAMRWLKTNTDKEALISTDRYYSVPLEEYSHTAKWTNRFFMYEVYSNRFSYFSGSGYILHKEDHPEREARIKQDGILYDENNVDRGRLAREIGIDYVVLSKRFTGDKDLENDDYELCFSNEDVNIYRVTEG